MDKQATAGANSEDTCVFVRTEERRCGDAGVRRESEGRLPQSTVYLADKGFVGSGPGPLKGRQTESCRYRKRVRPTQPKCCPTSLTLSFVRKWGQMLDLQKPAGAKVLPPLATLGRPDRENCKLMSFINERHLGCVASAAA